MNLAFLGSAIACLFLDLDLPRGPSLLSAGLGTEVQRRDSLRVGDEAPTFVLLDAADEDPVYLRDYTGKTLREPWKNKQRYAVVVSLWASWCEPCKTEIPLLMKMAEEFKTNPVKIFLINTQESPSFTADSVRALVKQRGYTLPCLLDNTTTVAQRYTARSLPMIVVIDKFGIVRKVNRGYHENFHLDISKLLRRLLAEETPPQSSK